MEQQKEMLIHRRKFEMSNFSAEKEKDKPGDWKSSAMYTHVGGYKFCIGVDANGCGREHGKSIHVYLWSMPGEFDEQLKWPAKAKFTIELINQQGGQNESSICQVEWDKPTRLSYLFTRVGRFFQEHNKLGGFLKDDTLFFNVNVSDVEVL